MTRFKYVAVALGLFLGGLVFATKTLATENITSVSLSSNRVTPGFALKFSLHSEANVRQNVNTSEPQRLPEGWMIEITKDENYPSGVWGIHQLLMSHNLTVDNSNRYTMTAPNEPGYYRVRLKDREGNFFASEIFEVANESSVTVDTTPMIPNLNCPLELGKAYKTRNSSAVFFVVRPYRAEGTLDPDGFSCHKRSFQSSKLFFTYFNSWSEVIVDDRIDSIPNDRLGFMPLGPKYDPKYGALVKVVNDPKVYLLLGGKRYWITSEDTFTHLGYSWNWVEDISEDLLYSYEEGSEIVSRTQHPNYTLIKYRGDNKVYRLEPDPSDSTRTVKRHIENEETFNSLGYRWDRIVTLGDSESYTNGESLRYTRSIRLEP